VSQFPALTADQTFQASPIEAPKVRRLRREDFMPDAGTPLRALIVEDSPDDAALIAHELRKSGFQPAWDRVETADAMRAALKDRPWDIIISDYLVPGFGGMQALQIAKDSGLDMPFIVISGKVDEETLIEVVKAGASDFLVKGRIGRLASVIKRELAVAEAQRGVRQAQAALERSERHFRKLIEGGADAFFVMDRAGRVIYRSPSGKELTGWSDEDVMGKGIMHYVVAEDLPLAQATIAETIRNPGKNARAELHLLRKDGAVVEVEATGRNLLADPDVGGIVVTVRDITERKISEKKLQESEARYRGIFEQAKDVIYMIDAGGIFVALSPSFEKITDWTAEEWLHKPFITIVHPDDRARAVEIVKQTISHQASSEFEMRIARKAGDYWTGEFTVSPLEIAGSTILFGIGRDITERRQAQDALNASRDLLTSVVEHAPIRVFWKDLELRYLGCNSLFARDAGLSRAEDLLGKEDFQMPWREQAELYRADDRRVIDSDTPKLGIEEPQSTPDGRTIWLRTSKVPLHTADGKVIGVLGIYDDVTERKQGETELKRLNWAMRALSQSNSALVHATTDQELFRSCCEAIAATEAYPLAWIGLAGEDPAREVSPVAAAGKAVGYMEGLRVSWADTPEGNGPTGRAIRTGTTQIVENFATSAEYAPWRERVRAHGLASGISLPIRPARKVIGALNVYSREAHAFGEAEVALFEELAGDIAYGIATRQMRAAYETSVLDRERGAVKLRKSLEDSIQAIAATVEARDPYTAGHEKRVAGLATAIATEMCLAADTAEGIHFGSLIHDLGKIRVPAEILSKPSRLSAIEFELIKVHAQAGYDILKGIDFPWPVAQMVRQHHERLNGSGYPQGLKGDEIILEARVLAVADTVEAMASHRPYRPGLGIDKALAEVERGRGMLFDPQVVDACLRLFRERGYKLPA
jgi:PAS domain S-box-containing protein